MMQGDVSLAQLREKLGQPAAADTRFAGPSRLRCNLLIRTPAIVFVLIALFDFKRTAPIDLWGLLRFGQDVVATGHPIHADLYSYAIAGHPWCNLEWLSGVIVALCYRAGGVIGLKLLRFATTAGTVIFLAAGMAQTGARQRIQIGLLVIASLSFFPFVNFRAQIFTYLLLGVLLFLLARHNFRGRAPLWLVVPMMALWANLHGGFVIGLTVFGVYIVTCFVRDFFGGAGAWRRDAGLAVLMVAAVAATLATPYGIETWLAVLHSLRSRPIHEAVAEWRPLITVLTKGLPTERLAAAVCSIPLFIMLAGFALSLVIRPQGDDGPMVAIGFLLAATAFIALRNIPLAIIGVLIPLSRHAELCLAAPSSDPPPSRKAFALHQFVFGAAGVVVLVATGLFTNRLPADQAYPGRLLAFMQSYSLHGNILDDVNWGNYLIWHCEPPSRVFVDNRFETAYPNQLLNEYFRFLYGKKGWSALLGQYHHDFVLIGVKRPAYRKMLLRRDWVLIYRDPLAALFAPAGSPATRISGIPVIGGAPRATYFP